MPSKYQPPCPKPSIKQKTKCHPKLARFKTKQTINKHGKTQKRLKLQKSPLPSSRYLKT
jgi:hypothetical protein